jgi:hypothetical protein
MTDADQNLMLEILKQLQADSANTRRRVGDIHELLIECRKDIHGLEGHSIRHDGQYAQIERRLERIERRLDLVDS